MRKLEILNRTVADARASIPTEISPEAKRPSLSDLLQEEDLVLARDAERRDAERKAKMSALGKQMQEAASPTQKNSPPLEQPPATPKQKRALKKKTFDGSIDVGVTLDLSSIPQLVEELKSATTAIYIPYSIDAKLSHLSKYLRHRYSLFCRGGISNKTLACLILDDVLKNVSYGEG
jgi:hypothetical protein